MENKFDHTPGPWFISEFNGTVVYCKMNGAEPGICDTEAPEMTPVSHKQAMANARLIAAAPDILVALQGLMSLIESGWLVRDTSEDGKPGFAMRQLTPMAKLQAAQRAIEKATTIKTP